MNVRQKVYTRDPTEEEKSYRPNCSEKGVPALIQWTRLLPPGKSTLKYSVRSSPSTPAAREWNVEGSETSSKS